MNYFRLWRKVTGIESEETPKIKPRKQEKQMKTEAEKKDFRIYQARRRAKGVTMLVDDESFKQRIQQAAADENRSVNNYLQEHLLPVLERVLDEHEEKQRRAVPAPVAPVTPAALPTQAAMIQAAVAAVLAQMAHDADPNVAGDARLAQMLKDSEFPKEDRRNVATDIRKLVKKK